MHWRNSNVEKITEVKLCSSFKLDKGGNPILKAVSLVESR